MKAARIHNNKKCIIKLTLDLYAGAACNICMVPEPLQHENCISKCRESRNVTRFICIIGTHVLIIWQHSVEPDFSNFQHFDTHKNNLSSHVLSQIKYIWNTVLAKIAIPRCGRETSNWHANFNSHRLPVGCRSWCPRWLMRYLYSASFVCKCYWSHTIGLLPDT